MKYYSELTKKVYDTEKELNEAEGVHTRAQKEKEEKLAVKKDEANKVVEAYKETIAVRKECNDRINAADKKFMDLKNEFIKKYGSWHMSYSTLDEGNDHYFDAFSYIFNFVNNIFNELTKTDEE